MAWFKRMGKKESQKLNRREKKREKWGTLDLRSRWRRKLRDGHSVSPRQKKRREKFENFRAGLGGKWEEGAKKKKP